MPVPPSAAPSNAVYRRVRRRRSSADEPRACPATATRPVPRAAVADSAYEIQSVRQDTQPARRAGRALRRGAPDRGCSPPGELLAASSSGQPRQHARAVEQVTHDYRSAILGAVPVHGDEQQQRIDREHERDREANEEYRVHQGDRVVRKDVPDPAAVLAVEDGSRLSVDIRPSALTTRCPVIMPDDRIRDTTN